MKIHALAKLENVTGNLSKETGNFCSNCSNYFRPCNNMQKVFLRVTHASLVKRLTKAMECIHLGV